MVPCLFLGFQGFRLVFHFSRSVFMVFQGSRLVFRGSRLVVHGSRLVFHGAKMFFGSRWWWWWWWLLLLLLSIIFPENFSQEGGPSLQNQHIHRDDYYHVPHNQVSRSIISAIIILILTLMIILTRRGAFVVPFKTILYPYPHHHRHTRSIVSKSHQVIISWGKICCLGLFQMFGRSHKGS